MCVHERLAFAFEMGARFGVVFAGWEPMYRNIRLVTGMEICGQVVWFGAGRGE